MLPRIAVLTPSGGRPWQLEQCRRYVARAAAAYGGDVEHLVVEGDNPPAENLLAALPRASTADVLAVVEDDDWYPADYLLQLVLGLRAATFFGFGVMRYYHVPSGGWVVLPSDRHAGLACTAWRAQWTPVVRHLLERAHERTFVDVLLWELARQQARPGWDVELAARSTMVGIKGLPGRAGAGIGHDAEMYARHDRPDRPVLRSWIGDADAEVYLRRIGKLPAAAGTGDAAPVTRVASSLRAGKRRA